MGAWLAAQGRAVPKGLLDIPNILRAAREALDAGEDRFRAICTCSPVAISLCDSEGRALYFNPRFYALTGASPESLGYGWDRIIHPEDREAVVRGWLEAARTGHEYSAEFRIVRAFDGAVRWFQVRSAPYRGDCGAEIRHIGMGEDVTERKEAESVLRDRARLSTFGVTIGSVLSRPLPLRDMLQSCAEAIVEHLDAALARVWLLDPQSDVLELQASAGIYTHVDGPHSRIGIGESKIGRIAQERIPMMTNAAVSDEHIADRAWVVREGVVAFAGYPLIVEDRLVGVMALFSRQSLSAFVLDALASAASGIAHGIERKRTEMALHESQTLLQSIIETEPECVKIVSPDGRLIMMNQAGLRMIEVESLEHVAGRPIEEIVVPEHRQAFRELTRQVCRGETAELQFEIVGMRGTRRWMETHAAPIRNPRDESVNLLAVTRDVSERKKSERQRLHLLHRLIATQEEERRRVARELHDETGQQLTGLMLGLRSLEQSGQLPEHAAAIVGNLVALTGGLMEQIHGLARDLRPAVLDDWGLRTALQRYCEEWTVRTGTILDFHSVGLDGERLPFQIEITIYRVVQEALTNVTRHASARGVSVLLERRQGHILVIVEDDGKGFDVTGTMQSAEPHYRLGLLGMHERAALVGGTLNLESAPGAGTSVFLKIPEPRNPANKAER